MLELKKETTNYIGKYLWRVMIFLGASLIYFITRSQVISGSHDAITLLSNIQNGDNLFHVHHVFFNSSAWLLHQTIKLFYTEMSAKTVIQLLNAIGGGILVTTIAIWIETHTPLKKWKVLPAIALPAFSFGIWFHSHTIEVYIIPIAILMVIITLIGRKPLSIRDWILIAILHWVAIGFHITNALLTVTLGIILWRRLKIFMIVTGITYTLTGLLYIGILWGYYHCRTLPEAIFTITEITHNQRYWNSPLQLTTYIKLIFSLGRTFIGGHFMLHPTLSPWALHFLKGHWIENEIYLVRLLNPKTVITLAIASIGWVTIFIGHLIFSIKKEWGQKISDPLFTLICWLIPYTLFFILWDTENIEFWLIQSLAIQLTLIYLITKQSKGAWKTLTALSLSLIAINSAGSILPMSNSNNDLYAVEAGRFIEKASLGDIILLDQNWQLSKYIGLKSKVTVLSLEDMYRKANQNQNDYRLAIQRLLMTQHKSGHKIIILQKTLNGNPILNQRYHSEFSTFGPYLDQFPEAKNTIIVI